ACCAPVAAQNYTFDTILECNNLTLFPAAMNGSGLVVGTAHDISGAGGGMTYYNGKCQTYPSLAFYGVSDTDWLIAGIKGGNGYYLIEPGPQVMPLPNYPGAQATSYCCIDTATGTLAGNYIPAGAPLNTFSGFFYQNGKFTSLPWSDASGSPSYEYTIAALNNAGIVVGTYQRNYVLGFVLAKGKMTLLAHPGATNTNFKGVNDNGVVVGRYDGPGITGVLLYNIATGTWTDLNFPSPYNGMTPVGISNTGVIALTNWTGGLVFATPH
ncbi:MAG: hypothetical protein JWO48_1695, partial [Bryobacterales bacterium]|nr:hypothetical protein [Bryobacterales bacterium]